MASTGPAIPVRKHLPRPQAGEGSCLQLLWGLYRLRVGRNEVVMDGVAAATVELIDRYSPDIEIPPPVVLEQARRNLALRAAAERNVTIIV